MRRQFRHHGAKGCGETAGFGPFAYNLGGRGFGGWGGRNWGGWGDFPFGFDHDRGPRGGRRRMFAGGELRLLLLRLIADEPRHGYQLIKAIEEMTGGSYSPSPGTVYPTLSLLADEGAIVESVEASEGDASRKAFAATDAGKAELEERADEVEAILSRLARIGERRKRERSPEMGRAAANLGRVLANKFAQGKLDGNTLEDIVDIIDEAARKIERL